MFAFAEQACDKGVQWERAVELLERMVERDGVKPNLFAYNHAMSACVRYARNALALCFCAHACTHARTHTGRFHFVAIVSFLLLPQDSQRLFGGSCLGIGNQ